MGRRDGAELIGGDEAAKGDFATEHGRAVASAELAAHLRANGGTDAVRAEESVARSDRAISERERDRHGSAAAGCGRVRVGDEAL
jgi:hypothetical protein